MLDASGHFPTGILSGNVNSFGDFQECLSVVNSDVSFKGKHCYVEMQPFVNKSTAPYIDYLRQYVQSFEIIKSRLEDVSCKNFTKKDYSLVSFFFSPRIYSVDFRLSFMASASHRHALIKM